MPFPVLNCGGSPSAASEIRWFLCRNSDCAVTDVTDGAYSIDFATVGAVYDRPGFLVQSLHSLARRNPMTKTVPIVLALTVGLAVGIFMGGQDVTSMDI